MLSSNSWRILCTRRASVSPSWPPVPRRAGQTRVAGCSINTRSVHDARHMERDAVGLVGTIRRALGEGKKTSFRADAVFPRSYCSGQMKPSCWNCKQTLENEPAFFCLACKVVQPPEEGTSFFKIMACDYTFTLDTQKLQRRYVQLQRSLHPDNFSQKSAEEQKYSETQSALVNKAYKTLLKPLSRGLYMLELQGMRIEEGTDSEADSEFLMELMEINEVLNEAQTAGEAEQIGRDVKGKLTDLTERIDAALLKGDLAAAKALLAQMKYYANIEEKVKEKLAELM